MICVLYAVPCPRACASLSPAVAVLPETAGPHPDLRPATLSLIRPPPGRKRCSVLNCRHCVAQLLARETPPLKPPATAPPEAGLVARRGPLAVSPCGSRLPRAQHASTLLQRVSGPLPRPLPPRRTAQVPPGCRGRAERESGAGGRRGRHLFPRPVTSPRLTTVVNSVTGRGERVNSLRSKPGACFSRRRLALVEFSKQEYNGSYLFSIDKILLFARYWEFQGYL